MTQQFYFWVYTQKNSMRVSKTYLYTYVHSITCNGQKVEASQYSSTDEWINKMYKHTVKCYSALKKEILTCARIRMNLGDIC